MIKWFKKHPDKEGEYWMKDSSGGPTLYVFTIVDDVLCHGTKGGGWMLPVGTGMIKSCRWKKVD